MKKLYQLILVVAFAIPLSSIAETISLRSTDGTEIILGYEKVEKLVIADSRTVWIDHLAMHIDRPGSGITAVLVANCSGVGVSSYQFTLKCSKIDFENWIHFSSRIGSDPNNQDCYLDAEPYIRNYIREIPPLRLSAEYRNGASQKCRYELAIVRDGIWLVDPVNGSHNFKLNF